VKSVGHLRNDGLEIIQSGSGIHDACDTAHELRLAPGSGDM
jgi:hypothetical protein